MNAAKIGLVVITLERYFKIVHRKYYRSWMTPVGVAMPWIAGICTFGIPATVTSRSVPGSCPLMGVWPSKDFRTVTK